MMMIIMNQKIVTMTISNEMTFSQTNIQDLKSTFGKWSNIEESIINNLSNELSKSIDLNIMLDIFSPETKGLPKRDRIKVINRDLKIDSIITGKKYNPFFGGWE